MAFLDININQVNSDFKSIKTAMTDVGVDIPDGTPTSEYAENIGEVYNIGYDAGHTNGQASMVDESKIIKKEAKGVGSLHLNDVSEIPHKVCVTLKSDTTDDFSGISIIKCRKNLFNPTISDDIKGVSITSSDDTLTITNSNTSSTTIDWHLRLGAGTYTFTNNNPSGGLTFYFYTRVSETDVWSAANVVTATSALVRNFNTAQYIRVVMFAGVGQSIFKIPQIEVGNISTEFEPYIGEVYEADTYGTFKEITSISPYMNIIANTDVNMEVTYNRSYGMQTEYDRFWDRLQNYGNRVAYSYSSGFGAGFGYKNFYPKYDIKPEGNAYQMFADFCQGDAAADLDLVERCKKCGITIDFSNATNLQYLFLRSLVGRVGVIDTRNSTTIAQMFYGATRVHTIDDLILKDDGTQKFVDLFYNCRLLKNLKITGKIGENGFNVSGCTLLTHDSLMSIINALADYKEDTSGTNWSITLGTANLAKLTEEDKAKAIEKGWSLA